MAHRWLIVAMVGPRCWTRLAGWLAGPGQGCKHEGDRRGSLPSSRTRALIQSSLDPARTTGDDEAPPTGPCIFTERPGVRHDEATRPAPGREPGGHAGLAPSRPGQAA